MDEQLTPVVKTQQGRLEFANPNHDPKNGRFSEGPGTGSLAEDVLRIAKEPGAGVTRSPRTGKEIKTGYIIARQDLSAHPTAKELLGPGGRKLYTDWLRKAKRSGAFKNNKVHAGIWHDDSTGMVFLDIVEQYPSNTSRAKAMELGRARNQKSIALLEPFEIIDTGGTGL